MITFEANTADDLWQSIRAEFSSQNAASHEESRCGSMREMLHVGLSIRDPQQHWVITRSPPMNPAFAIAEVVWIVTGRRDSAFLNFWNPRLPRYAGDGDHYYGAYGHRLRHHFGLDQLERAYQALSANRSSRQIVLQIWDPRFDLPSHDGGPTDPDIPCNLCSLLKVRNDRLEWMQIIRSNDFFLGMPHNFVQFMSLHEIIAGWLELAVGTYSQISDSLHLYEKDVANVEASAPFAAPRSTDSLRLPKHTSDEGFAALASRMDAMRESTLREHEIIELASRNALPTVMQNILVIVAADCARRRGWEHTARQLADECQNPLLRLMWDRWEKRKKQGGSAK